MYPYRHLAYTVWFVFPILMASLAFIDGRNAYVRLGTYCYLPVRPFWYRLALSWVPRYVIVLFILGIYASIYYYVRNKFHGFNKDGKFRPESQKALPNGKKNTKRQKRYNLPPTPTLACHGLIADASRQISVATDAEARKHSVSTLGSTHGAPLAKTGTSRFIWANILANNGSSSQDPPSELSSVDSDSFIGPSTPHPLPAYLGPPSPPNDVESIDPSQSRITSWRDDFVHRVTFSQIQSPNSKRSVADIFSALHGGPGGASTEAPTPISQLQLVNSRGQDLAVSEMLRTREKIRRQLRFLFIYPIVYIGMWIVPFASHVLQYDDRFADLPFGLTCATTIFLCSQAAVDCWLFSTLEKPWKHIHGSDGSFWGSLKFWSGWHGVRRKRRKFHGPGKTRDEMVREARAAYQRREEELAQRRLEAVRGAQKGERKRERTWWEAAGLDGAMRTVQEEHSDSLEDIEASVSTQSWDDETDETRVETSPSRETSKERANDKEKPTETAPS